MLMAPLPFLLHHERMRLDIQKEDEFWQPREPTKSSLSLIRTRPTRSHTPERTSAKQVVDQGGTITKIENMGRRQLAYHIGRKTEGIYMLFEIDGSGREIAELERRMRVSDQVLRYLTVRVDEDRRRAEKLRDQPHTQSERETADGPRRRRGDAVSSGGRGAEPRAR